MAATRLAAALAFSAFTVSAALSLRVQEAGDVQSGVQAAVTALRRGRPSLETALARPGLAALFQKSVDRQESEDAGEDTAFYPGCDSVPADFVLGSDCLNCLGEGTCDETTCCASYTNRDQTQLRICPVGSCCIRIIAEAVEGDGADRGFVIVEERSVAVGGTCGDALPDSSCSACGFAVDGEFKDCPEGVRVPPPLSPVPANAGRCVGEVEGAIATGEPSDSSGDATAADIAQPPSTEDDDLADATMELEAVEDEDESSPPPPGAEVGIAANEDDDGAMDAEDLVDEIFSCFPGSATVELEGGATVRMDSVAIGDSVKVGKDKYSEVFMFTHKLSAVNVQFVILRTASGASLALTGGHYIYANSKLVSASIVQVGDELSLADGGASCVVSVGRATRTGLYNPQTVDGNIVVSGILASTYTTAVEPGLAHMALAPLRALNRLGLSFSFLESGGGAVTAVTPKGSNQVL